MFKLIIPILQWIKENKELIAEIVVLIKSWIDPAPMGADGATDCPGCDLLREKCGSDAVDELLK